MSILIRGDRLAPATRAEVLRAYVLRWTTDNAQRASAWYGLGAPTIPLVSDAQWLMEHAFWVTKRGTLDARAGRRHAEPAFMVEGEA